MDFEKIYSLALDKAITTSIKKIINKDNETFKFDDPEIEKDIKTIKMMQEFSALVAIETVKIYHEELKKELAKNGINI